VIGDLGSKEKQGLKNGRLFLTMLPTFAEVDC
jgi:hypothetical protein